jgi:hypothetical protein
VLIHLSARPLPWAGFNRKTQRPKGKLQNLPPDASEASVYWQALLDSKSQGPKENEPANNNGTSLKSRKYLRMSLLPSTATIKNMSAAFNRSSRRQEAHF